MQSVIISGGFPENRQTKISEYLNGWGINRFDYIAISPDEDHPSIGIGEVKNMIRNLSRTPQFSPFSAALILNAEHLTTEAQNALLKTLEEPPPHARIIIECGSADILLPTIRSRCFEINLPKLSDISTSPGISNLDTLLSETAGKKLKQAETSAAYESSIPDFIANLAITLHTILLGQYGITGYPEVPDGKTLPVGKITKTLSNIIRANRYLEANINPKSALDSLFL
jgi:hypothetical protein